MQKQIKNLITGSLIIIFVSAVILAAAIQKTTNIIITTSHIIIDNKEFTVDNMLYNGMTYVPLKTIAEMFDKDVMWDSITNTIVIYNKLIEQSQPVSQNITNNIPQNTDIQNIDASNCGYTVGRYNKLGDFYSVTYGIEIKNLNSNVAAQDVKIIVSFLDEDGNVLNTISKAIPYIPPKTTALFGDDTSISKIQPSSMTVVAIQASWDEKGYQIPNFLFSNLQYISNDSGYFGGKVTGRIQNPYNRNLKDVKVTYIVYDNNGEIEGGGYTYIDLIMTNSEVVFSDSLLGSLDGKTVHAYATVGLFENRYIE